MKKLFQNMTINQSLAHGLEILLLYDTSHVVFTVSEISKKLGYSQSKDYRLVRTLIKYGLLQEKTWDSSILPRFECFAIRSFGPTAN